MFGDRGMTQKKEHGSGDGNRRKARLAEALRANLQKRKAQMRSRRTGEADTRPEGLAAAEKPKE
ncbi:hypothetical protein ASD50_07065 [Mesorhizobium sp. Root552]|nr:hypothetical protein ASD50_07065 [Mesorhizobium sp. Root552]